MGALVVRGYIAEDDLDTIFNVIVEPSTHSNLFDVQHPVTKQIIDSCLPIGCAHLDGGDWQLMTDEEAEDYR
jgi:hypothetical protein